MLSKRPRVLQRTLLRFWSLLHWWSMCCHSHWSWTSSSNQLWKCHQSVLLWCTYFDHKILLEILLQFCSEICRRYGSVLESCLRFYWKFYCHFITAILQGGRYKMAIEFPIESQDRLQLPKLRIDRISIIITSLWPKFFLAKWQLEMLWPTMLPWRSTMLWRSVLWLWNFLCRQRLMLCCWHFLHSKYLPMRNKPPT
jgi:hypothetical protein